MANRIKGITMEIGGDTTGPDKALKCVNSSITKTQSARRKRRCRFWILWMTGSRYLIAREKFEEYIDSLINGESEDETDEQTDS